MSEPDVTALTLKIAGAIGAHASDNTGTKAEAIMQVVVDSEWLAAIRAEAKAEAWDEGEQAGRDNADDGYPDPMVENPYRDGSLEQPTDDNPRARLARRFGLDPDELTELTVEIEAGRPDAVVRWRGVRRIDEAQLADVHRHLGERR